MTGQYEVVIHADDGVEQLHADMIRERLLRIGFYEDVVAVREVSDDE